MSHLNRQTVRLFQQPRKRGLHNATVSACAKALGLSVNELQARLSNTCCRTCIARRRSARRRSIPLYDRATQPEVLTWITAEPPAHRQLTDLEVNELLSLQGTGGPLTTIGVEHYVGLIERKRKLLGRVHAVAGTEYLNLLEQLVELLYEKVQAYPEK